MSATHVQSLPFLGLFHLGRKDFKLGQNIHSCEEILCVWGNQNPDFVQILQLFNDCTFINASVLKAHQDTGVWVLKSFRPGQINPKIQSLRASLTLKSHFDFYIYDRLKFDLEVTSKEREILERSWREPAIEVLKIVNSNELSNFLGEFPKIKNRVDDSLNERDSKCFGLEFEPAELIAIEEEEKKRGCVFNRAEIEVLAQSWSEHCKHKIFGAEIECTEGENIQRGLFRTFIKDVTQEIIQNDKTKNCDRALSVFDDNAGVLRLFDGEGKPTEQAYCLKMETHNSPSALSPRGGAATGLVGVHRDILGTGLGARPVANWNVLCFESPTHHEPRPEGALPADVIRAGVLAGIEEGGNQSGVPTVSGSVVFDPSFSVKPYVFAGAVGLLPEKFVHKKPKSGLFLYVVGGETGIDGLRGAVMSSRDLRAEDFVGSAVQVAQAFVQRRLYEFLLEARDLELIDCLTDNGAGGLSSSVGEMAGLTGGAKIDLSKIRLKSEGLHSWEKLLSESQERMTLATTKPKELENLARKWRVDFDSIGNLSESGAFEVWDQGNKIVDLDLEFLSKGCPRLKLKCDWSEKQEEAALKKSIRNTHNELPLLEAFEKMLGSEHLCSRAQIARRFDHEVGGRSLKKIFAGSTQASPADAALVEIHEAGAAIVLSHGLWPQISDIHYNTLLSFDEALRSAILSGAQLNTAGVLDNYAWPDPMGPKNMRRLWRLKESVSLLAYLCREWQLPLVSGKDSLKNNAKDFACAETLVVSMGASSCRLDSIPVQHFSKPNDVVFYCPPLLAGLRDSAAHRVGVVSNSQITERPSLISNLKATSEFVNSIEILKQRYQSLGTCIKKAQIKVAKDISEGGLLMTLFEMSIGSEFGITLEVEPGSINDLVSEGVGGFVLAADPHLAGQMTSQIPGLKRLGVVTRDFSFRWVSGFHWKLANLKQAYTQKGQEGFWS